MTRACGADDIKNILYPAPFRKLRFQMIDNNSHRTTQAHRIYVPNASADRAAWTGQLSDLWHGARASGSHCRRVESRADRYDEAAVDQRRLRFADARSDGLRFSPNHANATPVLAECLG